MPRAAARSPRRPRRRPACRARSGNVAPIIAVFTLVAIGLHVTYLRAAPFLWTEVGRSVFFTFQRPYGLCLLAFGLLAGLALRFRKQNRPLGNALRSLTVPGRLWPVLGGAAVGVTLALAFNDDRSALDWLAAAILGLAMLSARKLMSTVSRSRIDDDPLRPPTAQIERPVGGGVDRGLPRRRHRCGFDLR